MAAVPGPERVPPGPRSGSLPPTSSCVLVILCAWWWLLARRRASAVGAIVAGAVEQWDTERAILALSNRDLQPSARLPGTGTAPTSAHAGGHLFVS
eukprot:355645-Chlamydomonas_euryale.AAC.20